MTSADPPRADDIDPVLRLMDYCSTKGTKFDALVRTAALCVAHRHGAATVEVKEKAANERGGARAAPAS